MQHSPAACLGVLHYNRTSTLVWTTYHWGLVTPEIPKNHETLAKRPEKGDECLRSPPIKIFFCHGWTFSKGGPIKSGHTASLVCTGTACPSYGMAWPLCTETACPSSGSLACSAALTEGLSFFMPCDMISVSLYLCYQHAWNTQVSPRAVAGAQDTRYLPPQSSAGGENSCLFCCKVLFLGSGMLARSVQRNWQECKPSGTAKTPAHSTQVLQHPRHWAQQGRANKC